MIPKENIPLYKSKFSSGGVLQNDIFPEHIDRLMNSIGAMLVRDKPSVRDVYANLYTLIPVYSKFFKDYALILAKVKGCRVLLLDWMQAKMSRWPSELETELLQLYEDWWLAFNESGLGVEFEQKRK